MVEKMEKIEYNGLIFKKTSFNGLMDLVFSYDPDHIPSFSTEKSRKLFRNPHLQQDVVIVARYTGTAYYSSIDMDYQKNLGWDEIRPTEIRNIEEIIEKILVGEKTYRIFSGWLGDVEDLTEKEEQIIRIYDREIESIIDKVEKIEKIDDNKFYNF